jgi:hypothetical protein
MNRSYEVNNSSNIKKVEFLDTHDIVRITFKGGQVYNYKGVKAPDKKALEEACKKDEHVGTAFGQYIRPYYKGLKI